MQRANVLALILGLSVSGCAEEPMVAFEDREDRLEDALSKDLDQFSSSPVWLVKRSSYAPNDRTAVFFGYVDNQDACEEFAEAYEKVFDAEEYACVELAI